MGSTFEFEKCTCIVWCFLLFFSGLFFHVVDATIYIFCTMKYGSSL